MRNIIYYLYANFFAKNFFFKWNSILFNLSLRGMGIMNFHNFKISGEKNFIKFILKNYQITNVFDIGANIGKYTETFEKIAKKYKKNRGLHRRHDKIKRL